MFLGLGKLSKTSATVLPLSWGPEDKVRWKASIHSKRQSSPVLRQDTVYVTSTEGDMKETYWVTTYSLHTGEIKWSCSVPSEMPQRSNDFQSRSAPTSTVDESTVVAFFETGNLVGLNRKTGDLIWKRSLVSKYGAFESTIGLATSPIRWGPNVYLMIDHEGDSYLLACDRMTGETKWRTEGFSLKIYTLPSIISIGNCEQIVCSSDGSVDGYDLEIGDLLWTFEELSAKTSSKLLTAGPNAMLIGASSGKRGAT